MPGRACTVLQASLTLTKAHLVSLRNERHTEPPSGPATEAGNVRSRELSSPSCPWLALNKTRNRKDRTYSLSHSISSSCHLFWNISTLCQIFQKCFFFGFFPSTFLEFFYFLVEVYF